MTGDHPDEGFLQRWSRRKRGPEQEDLAETGTRDGDVAAEAGPEPADAAQAPEDPELVANREAAEAVDLEALTYESDFTLFMKRGVPEALKTAALRKLWRSNPVLAVLDGLNDYDQDFRTVQPLVGGFQSAWKVGRGYADKAEEVAAEMEARSAALHGREQETDTVAEADAEARAADAPEALKTGEMADEEAAVAAGRDAPENATPAQADATEKPTPEPVEASIDSPRTDRPRRRMSFDV